MLIFVGNSNRKDVVEEGAAALNLKNFVILLAAGYM